MNLSHVRSRSHIIKLIRRFFDERGYTEMHTPRLVGLPGQEPHLEPFWTEVDRRQTTDDRRQDLKNCHLSSVIRHLPAALITSPEYAMKRLLAEGMDKIYDLGPCFRNNEPWDGTHDPEFLMLEWYRKIDDRQQITDDRQLQGLMDETEEMVKFVIKNVIPREVGAARDLQYGTAVESFQRITVKDAWKEYIDVDLDSLLDDRNAIADLAIKFGQTVTPDDSWDDIYFKIFLSCIEPLLTTHYSLPTFLYRYPSTQAALARRCADDPRYADRVELYIGGLELANGFAELVDAEEQRKRFEEERTLRRAQGKKTWPLDEKFLEALPKMGNAAGIAFGVDRFVMLLTGAKSINDIVPFSARERFVSGKAN